MEPLFFHFEQEKGRTKVDSIFGTDFYPRLGGHFSFFWGLLTWLTYPFSFFGPRLGTALTSSFAAKGIRF